MVAGAATGKKRFGGARFLPLRERSLGHVHNMIKWLTLTKGQLGTKNVYV